MTNKSVQTTPNYSIQVLNKCFELLDIIAKHKNGITLAELSKALKMPKSSVFRYLFTCEEHGIVERLDDGDSFKLGIRLFELGQVVQSNLDVRELALPVMRTLLNTFHETVNLAVRDGTEIVYIEILTSGQSLRMAAEVGSRDDLYSTALGKAIMAFTPEEELTEIISGITFHKRSAHTITDGPTLLQELGRVKLRGYSLDYLENEDGVCCAGAPILNFENRSVAAISVSGPLSRIDQERLTVIGKEVSRHAEALSKKLGHTG